MIYDNLSQSNTYLAINPWFGQAFDFIKNSAPSLEDGRYEIDGDNCYAIIYSSDLKEVADAKLEVHDRYIDVQTVLHGVESFGISPRQLCQKPIGEIDNEKDILFFEDPATNFITVQQGEFAIFMPNDAHAPLIGKGSVRKAVVKVKYKF